MLESVEPVVTRTLRWPYIAAAILALLLVGPLLRLRRREERAGERPTRIGRAVLAAVGVVAVGLLAYEFAGGAASFGPRPAPPSRPIRARASPPRCSS